MNKHFLKDKFNNFEVAIFNNFEEKKSGDLFKIYNLDDKRSLFIIADACGKGKDAYPLKKLFLQIVDEKVKKFSSLSSFMSEINVELNKAIKDEKYLSAFGALLDNSSGSLTFSNAGHPEQLLVKSDGNYSIIMLDTSGFLLGMFNNGKYEEKTIQFSKKDMIVFYTDGFEEEFYKVKNIEFNNKLSDLLKTTTDSEEILEKLTEDLEIFDAKNPQDDSLVGILKISNDKEVQAKIIVSISNQEEDQKVKGFLTEKNMAFEGPSSNNLHAYLKKGGYLILITDNTDNNFLSDLRKEFPEVRIIIISTEKSIRAALSSLKLGVYRYLESPYNTNDLFQYIVKVFDKNIPDVDMIFEKSSEDWLEINAPASFEFSERLDKYLSKLIKVTKVPQEVIDDISYAFLEMTNNAIEWGCKKDITKNFHITYTVFSDRIIFKIEDGGEGFDFKKFFDVEDVSLVESEETREKSGKRPGGLGIYLVKQCMDELKFNEKGNIVLMIKYLEGLNGSN